MVDGIVEVISKPEFLEVSHTDFYNHISLINKIVSEDKLEILTEFGSSSSTDANVSEIERLIDEKSGKPITANIEKKITSSSRIMTSKACQVNFDEINIKNCYRSGCQALQNKKMAEEIKLLREEISKKMFIIKSLFSLKLSNHKENNWFHKVRKNTNAKYISESCINDEIPECKCVNGPIEDDIALHKKSNYNQNTDEGSNNLLTTSINNYKTSENNTVRTTETPNNNGVINDNLTAPTQKEKFRTNTASFKLG